MKPINHYKRNSAHNLVDKGFSVIALNGKQPIKGSNGSRDATRDHGVIDLLWSENPYRNIGICTGSEYGLAILDVDCKSGNNGFEALTQEFGSDIQIDNNESTICQTPNGGMHLYCLTNGIDVCNAQDILSGVDIRGRGGYVVAPPSSIKIGGKWVNYTWFNQADLITQPPEFVKDLFLRTITRKKNIKTKTTLTSPYQMASTNFQLGFEHGQRDEGLHSLACSFRSNRIEKQQALIWIEQAAFACSPPFDCEAARAKVERAYSFYPAG